MDKTELFLNELESLLSRYFDTDWNYDFDFDKPITIDVPIQADDKLDTGLYRRNLPKSRISHEQLHCISCKCQDPRLTDEEYNSIIDSVTEEGYEDNKLVQAHLDGVKVKQEIKASKKWLRKKKF